MENGVIHTINATAVDAAGNRRSSTMRQTTLFAVRPVEKDICANRHGGAETSVLADKRVAKQRDRELIYGYIKEAGQYGHTLDELSVALERSPNCLSGRLTELRKEGRIVYTDFTRFTRTRSRARVYVAR